MASAWPDVEALIVANVTGYDLTVQAVGGVPGQANAQASHLIQLDVRADTKAAAREDAYSVLDSVLTLQRTHPEQAGRVTVQQLPSWLPEADGEPRYVSTVTVANRTLRDVTHPE